MFRNPIEFLFLIPIVLFSLSVHEWAHAFAAYRLGDPTARNYGRLTLNPLRHFDIVGSLCMLLFGFGWAKPVPIQSRYFKKPRRDMALSSLAGPLSNLVVAYITFLIYRFTTLAYFSASGRFLLMTAIFFELFCYLNLSLAVFNLLPIPPLDGSRLLYLFLPPKWSWKLAQWERYSFFLLLALLLVFDRFNFITWIVNKILFLFECTISFLPWF